MLRKKNTNIKPLFTLRGFIVATVLATMFPASTPIMADSDEALKSSAVLPVIEISMQDTDPISTIKNLVIEQKSQTDASLKLENIDIVKSTASIDGLNRTASGIQTITAKITLANKEGEIQDKALGYSFIQQVAIKMVDTTAPVLKLKDTKVVVNNGDTFNPSSFISYINDDSGVLPALKIDSNVDMSTDGEYMVNYEATDLEGNTTSAILLVEVKTPQEVIEARIAAEQERLRLEEEARKEAERKEQEEARQKAIQAAQAGGSYIVTLGNTGSGDNPYSGGWSNCTYGAWQAAYDYTGIALPNFGNAYSWINSANANGYSTGYVPAVGAIAVYRNHVAYVTEVSGDSVHIVEGGFNGHYNERWVSADGTGTQALRGYIYLQ